MLGGMFVVPTLAYGTTACIWGVAADDIGGAPMAPRELWVATAPCVPTGKALSSWLLRLGLWYHPHYYGGLC